MMPVISNAATLATAKQTFDYLAKPPQFVPGAPPGTLSRKVAALTWEPVSDTEELEKLGLPIRLFPVHHGDSLEELCNQFLAI